MHAHYSYNFEINFLIILSEATIFCGGAELLQHTDNVLKYV